jgi:hypothetical protein
VLSKGVRRRPGANSRRRPAAMLRPSYNSWRPRRGRPPAASSSRWPLAVGC